MSPPHRNFAEKHGYALSVEPLRSVLIGNAGSRLGLIEAGAGFLLALAVGILGNLVIIRFLGKRHEQALRVVLGAGRWQLFTETLAETMALALAGGVLALLFAWLGTFLLTHYGFGTTKSAFSVRMNDWTVLVTFILALLAGLFSAVPAGLQSHMKLLTRLQEGPRGAPGRVIRWTQRGLASLQVALGVALLINAILIGVAFYNLSSRPLGFSPNHLVVADLQLHGPSYTTIQGQMALSRQLTRSIHKLPGLKDSGIASAIPFGETTMSFAVKSHLSSNNLAFPFVVYVGGNALPALGMSATAGRLIDSTDVDSNSSVAVMDTQLQRSVFGPMRAPINKSVTTGGGTFRIVGITKPVLWMAHAPGAFTGTLFLPYSLLSKQVFRQLGAHFYVAVRSHLPPKVVSRELRHSLLLNDNYFVRLTTTILSGCH